MINSSCATRPIHATARSISMRCVPSSISWSRARSSPPCRRATCANTSMIVCFSSAGDLYPDPRASHLRRKQIVRRQQARGEALRMGEAAERVERRPVALDAVGKRILAESLRQRLGERRNARKGNARGGDVAHALQAALLGGLEGLEEVLGEPRIALMGGAPQHQHMHDRKNLRLLEIAQVVVLIAREEPCNLVAAGREGAGHP